MSLRREMIDLIEDFSTRKRSMQIKKSGNSVEAMFPLDHEVDDPDEIETMGQRLNQMLRGTGVTIDMAMDDTGKGEVQEPWLRITVTSKPVGV